MKRRKYTKEMIEAAVKSSTSVMQVLRILGIPEAGGNHSHIKRMIDAFDIDVSHFLGCRSNQGRTFIERRRTSDEILTAGKCYREKTKMLKRSLLERGKIYECIVCDNNGVWHGLPITLEIDHINNDWRDDRIDNLQFLCPNCHSQKTAVDGSKKKYIKQRQSGAPSLIPTGTPEGTGS